MAYLSCLAIGFLAGVLGTLVVGSMMKPSAADYAVDREVEIISTAPYVALHPHPTVGHLMQGQVGWVAPWAIHRDEKGFYIPMNTLVSDHKGGTSNVAVRRIVGGAEIGRTDAPIDPRIIPPRGPFLRVANASYDPSPAR